MQQLSYKKADGNGHYLSQKLLLYPPVSPVTTTTTAGTKVVLLHIYICYFCHYYCSIEVACVGKQSCYLTDVVLLYYTQKWLLLSFLIDLSAIMQKSGVGCTVQKKVVYYPTRYVNPYP